MGTTLTPCTVRKLRGMSYHVLVTLSKTSIEWTAFAAFHGTFELWWSKKLMISMSNLEVPKLYHCYNKWPPAIFSQATLHSASQYNIHLFIIIYKIKNRLQHYRYIYSVFFIPMPSSQSWSLSLVIASLLLSSSASSLLYFLFSTLLSRSSTLSFLQFVAIKIYSNPHHYRSCGMQVCLSGETWIPVTLDCAA